MQYKMNTNPLHVISERLDINSALAQKFYDDKEFDKAADYYKEILKEYIDISKMESKIKDNFTGLAEIISCLKIKISECYTNSGKAYADNNEFENAINSYKVALIYNSNDYKISYYIGLSFRGLKRFDKAITFLKKAIKLNPSFADTYKIIGDIFVLDKKIKEEEFKAYKYYAKFITMNKSDGYVYNNLAYLLMENPNIKYKSINKQIQYLTKAEELLPDLELPLRNLTMIYDSTKEYDKLAICYEKLKDKFPNKLEYFYFLSLAQFQIGQLDEGLKNYQYRLKIPPILDLLHPNKPLWKGSSLEHKQILIVWEQLFGDNIQFCRYLPFLEKLTPKIIFRCKKELYSLIKHNYPNIQLIPEDTEWSKIKFDVQSTLVSLPHCLNINFEEIPYKEGYLKANPEKAAILKKELFENDDLKIGIHWNGNHIGEKNRIINLESFFPIAKLKEVKLYSLQTKDESSELDNLPAGINIINICEKIQDFDDSAAIIENMDLVITNDSSIVHLAGAMGKKTFLLLPKYSDWRWFSNQETTEWYNSVKIFKQKEVDNWQEVMDRVLTQVKLDYSLK